MWNNLYPELVEAGGLNPALDIILEKIESPLRCVQDKDHDVFPFDFARIERGSRFCQVNVAAEKKLFLPDFWEEGVCLANAGTSSLDELAGALDRWLNSDVKISGLLLEYPWIKVSEKALAFESGDELAFSWNRLLLANSTSPIGEFIKLAILDDQISRLFPFTSHFTLCFSKCTGYPYETSGLPTVTPQGEHLFVVRLHDHSLVGEGNAEEALAMVKNLLPADLNPAVKGTAEDFRS